MNKVGEYVRDRRLKLGMSQNELANKLGYTSRTSISKIEKGESTIPIYKIKKFANALDINIDELISMILKEQE